jgi:tetrahydromethanopterin S-methyltransferase subunit B
MSALLNVRDAIRDFLRKYDELITPIFRFVVAYVMLLFVNSMYGYEPLFDKGIVTLLLSIIFALVSDRVVVLATSLIMLMNVLSVSSELAILFFVALVAMYCMYIRFFPDSAWIILLVMVLYQVKLTYAIPMIVMMFAGMTGIIPIAFGGILYYVSIYVAEVNQTLLQTSEDVESSFQPYKYVLNSFKDNKTFMVQIIVFAVAIIIGNIFYRLAIDYAWYIGLAVCAVVSMLFFVICGAMLGVDVEIAAVFIGTIIGLVVALVVQVFKCVVDYSRKENVQFEDDEYYYYVKAIPKYNIDTKKTAPKQQPRSTSAAGRNVSERVQEQRPRSGQPAGTQEVRSRVRETQTTRRP